MLELPLYVKLGYLSYQEVEFSMLLGHNLGRNNLCYEVEI